jgi:hypothetical protein
VPIPFRRLLWPKSLAGKAGVVSLLLAIGLIALYGVASYRVSVRLKEAWKLSDEFGLSNNVQELLGPFVPPENNAAIPLDNVQMLAKRVFAAAVSKHKLATGERIEDTPAYQTGFDELMHNSEYERLLDDAERAPDYRSTATFRTPLSNTLLDNVQERRWLARAERIINERLIARGKREEAVRRILRQLRLIRKWENKEPFTMSILVNIAVRGVAFSTLNLALRSGGPLQASLHDETEAELQEQQRLNRSLPLVIQWDKLAFVATMDDEIKNRRGIGRPFYDQEKVVMLCNADRMMSAWDKPFLEVKRTYDEIERSEKARSVSPFFALSPLATTVATTRMTHFAVFRAQARTKCLRVVNAWAKRGNFDLELDELGLPNDCLTDPYDGEHLRVKRQPDGPIIYAISDDLVDDGGNVGPSPRDQGYGPPSQAAAK